GSDRKTTGSYYTPPELVAQLIKSALEPVIEEKLRESEKGKLEQALLSLKVCAPACGSGHFLLATARRIGKELAIIRTGEPQPAPEALRHAIRDVVQNCIYGVDLNPLAVDLCKVALWIEGFCKGMPLNFLDHRIKCGNSLVGVLDLECLNDGIPSKAFQPVTGDDKALASKIRKNNQKQLQQIENAKAGFVQLSLNLEGTTTFESQRLEYILKFIEVGHIPEDSTQQVKLKQTQYQRSRENPNWWRDFSACNLWTAAFFMPLTPNHLILLPTTEALNRLLYENDFTQIVIEAANNLAKQCNFFHWPLEFPEVFPKRNELGPKTEELKYGFDCVLGNPPWERIKLQEKEFFAAKDFEIANAQNKAAREKLIKLLSQTNPKLLQEFEVAKHDAEAQSKFIRESGRFPLTAVGDINTYAVFAETTRKLINSQGRVGIIVPTGIATDNTTKDFFGDLIKTQSLGSLYDFENKEAIFSAVHRGYKFSLLALTGKPIKCGNFAFFLTQPKQLENQKRLFQLSPQEIALINPNTLTCPVFRTRQDAELTKKIYQYVPVLENEETKVNPWGISFMRMFDMSNDSGLFENEAGENLLPLYEAKMFHQFTHRWATYTDDGNTRDLTDLEKSNPDFKVNPRYWVDKKEVENKLAQKWNKKWLLGWRDVTNSTNERTVISTIFPLSGCNDKFLLMLPSVSNIKLISCLLACLNSLSFDFIARQKIGGTALKYFTMRQLPVIPPDWYTPE
ncbi:MAG: Eco57I restriction-modification methylase domain-containing protein, partial [Planktothrix sp.]|uniref:Eco57I restriction-modification methylase domain-containing protein n=1 Tax=Planktothrix sp. TaxID=3088171 RepID=UPI0038D45399